MSLHDLASDPDHPLPPPLVGTAAWGTVTWIDNTTKRLRCTVDEYDGGEIADFGPVPYGDLSGSETAVAVGDRVLLIATADGDEPAAALKFAQ